MPQARVTLLLGKEDFFKREFLESLRDPAAGGVSEAMNRQEMKPPSQPLAPFLDFVTTTPFLAENRLGIIHDVEKLPAPEQESLLRILDRLTESSKLVLLSDESGTKKNSFIKRLAEICTVRFCLPLFENELPGWIQIRAKRAGRTLTPAAVAALVQRIGRDLTMLDTAIGQLSVYTQGRTTTVDAGDVEALFGRSAQQDVFKLVGFLIEDRPEEALARLSALFNEGVRPQEIIGALAFQLERFKTAADLLRAGRDRRQVCDQLRIRPAQQSEFLRQTQAFCRQGRLEKRLRSLFDCDRSIKSGGLRENAALEGWVLRGDR